MDSSVTVISSRYIVADPVAVLGAYGALADMGDSAMLSALLFDGPPGTGKTFLAKHLAAQLSAKLLHFQFFEGCDRRDMMWEKDITADGEFRLGSCFNPSKCHKTNGSF